VARWNAPGTPGRFQLIVDGTPLEASFGTAGAEWGWQPGGSVTLPAGEVSLVLHDLTGFDGRCDCIAFTTGPEPNIDLFLNPHAFAVSREGRRILGDVVLRQEDIVTKKAFPDGCVPSTWSIDLHYPKQEYARKLPDNPFISIAVHDGRVDRSYGYPIPYRCFYSKDIDNLFMAGRCISVSHEALGTVRVMKTCGPLQRLRESMATRPSARLRMVAGHVARLMAWAAVAWLIHATHQQRAAPVGCDRRDRRRRGDGLHPAQGVLVWAARDAGGRARLSRLRGRGPPLAGAALGLGRGWDSPRGGGARGAGVPGDRDLRRQPGRQQPLSDGLLPLRLSDRGGARPSQAPPQERPVHLAGRPAARLPGELPGLARGELHREVEAVLGRPPCGSGSTG
jgi:hypothetical protein